jgi:hypothetical protein
MKMRHAECKDFTPEIFHQCFDEDFRSGLSVGDYLWPVTLFTIVSLMGWLVALGRAAGSSSGLNELLPPAIAYGFIGAFMSSLFMIFDDFRTLTLDPYDYYSATARVLFASIAAYVIGLAMPGIAQAALPLVALGIGLSPMEDVRSFIVNKTSQMVGTAGSEGERGIGLKVIQGLEDREVRKRLVDMNVATVQALATSDPFTLFFQTTLPLRSIIDMIDKAILYLYIGDTVSQLRQHGINGVIELVALAHLGNKEPAYEMSTADAAIDPFFANIDASALVTKIASLLKQDPDELRGFIYNCYYDPQISLIYDIWGKYLNPKMVKPAPPLAASKAAGAA